MEVRELAGLIVERLMDSLYCHSCVLAVHTRRNSKALDILVLSGCAKDSEHQQIISHWRRLDLVLITIDGALKADSPVPVASSLEIRIPDPLGYSIESARTVYRIPSPKLYELQLAGRYPLDRLPWEFLPGKGLEDLCQ